MSVEKQANPTKAQIEAIMGDLKPEDRKILEQHLKGGGRARRTSETDLLKKYPHAIEGTLRFNEKSNKQEMDFTCQHADCDVVGTAATSDLFQVTMCPEHKKEQAKAKKAAKDARIKEILAAAEAKKV